VSGSGTAAHQPSVRGAEPVPMTLAHPAAVLPLRRLGMPMGAMVIGSMVPDVPLFMRWSSGYQVSHSFAGVFTVNLIAALVVLYGWNAFVRDALVDQAPDAVRVRLAARHRLSRRQWLLAPAAAVLGSLTHLAWDAFTHPGRWGVAHVAWLRADLGGLPAFKWAQYASGVIGLAVVLWAVIADVRSRPASQPPRRRALPAPLLPLVVGAAGVWGLVAGTAQVSVGLHAVAFHGVVQGIIAVAVGLGITCMAWLFATRLHAVRV
jgi:Domain of unknown function (DUF4184)